MQLEAFCQQIRFAALQPEMPLIPGLPQPLDFEFANTALPCTPAITEMLYTLCENLPRMSSLAIAAILDTAVRQMPTGSCYLNIGIWKGFSFLAGLSANPERSCIGVDNFAYWGASESWIQDLLKRHGSPLHHCIAADFREYLQSQHQQPIGVYFYDGPHDYQSQYEALVLAEPFLVPGAIILIDDTNWPEVRQSGLDFMQNYPGYRCIFEIQTAHNRHPTFWNGLMILHKELLL